jgi:hypothetical protein
MPLLPFNSLKKAFRTVEDNKSLQTLTTFPLKGFTGAFLFLYNASIALS